MAMGILLKNSDGTLRIDPDAPLPSNLQRMVWPTQLTSADLHEAIVALEYEVRSKDRSEYNRRCLMRVRDAMRDEYNRRKQVPAKPAEPGTRKYKRRAVK
jgi:hypothetical protein